MNMNTQESTTQGTSTWTIDAAHSRVEFTARHMMITKVRGRFSDVSGRIRLDEEDPSRSLVEVEIGASSVDTRQGDRDGHLRSADFLNVEAHPRLTFRSRRVEDLRLDPGVDFRVVGDLTIRGVTKEVTLEAEYGGTGADPWGGERIAFTGQTKVDRREFGLEWNQVLETGGVLVGNEVTIDLEVQAVRESADAT
jgi:polyisoprenoid-binding protein YceI